MKGSEMAGDKQSVKCNHNRFTAQPKSTLLITFERALHLRAEEEFSASSSGFKDNSSLSHAGKHDESKPMALPM